MEQDVPLYTSNVAAGEFATSAVEMQVSFVAMKSYHTVLSKEFAGEQELELTVGSSGFAYARSPERAKGKAVIDVELIQASFSGMVGHSTL